MKNNTNDKIDKSNLKLTIYDKDNNVLLISIINNVKEFNVGDQREIQVSCNNNVSSATKYVIEKVSEWQVINLSF